MGPKYTKISLRKISPKNTLDILLYEIKKGAQRDRT